MAAEIYFHVVMWQISIGASGWDGQGGLKQDAYDFYESASETDLEDGGDSNPGVTAGMWALWNSTPIN